MQPFLNTQEMLDRLRAAGVPCCADALRAAEREAVIPAWRTARGDLLFGYAAAVATFRAIQARRSRRNANLRRPERTCR
jgi:hypothetical protein